VITKEKKKVLFCYVQFHHYRVPIWKELTEKYDVTVLHGSKVQTDGRSGFREISSPPIKVWRFFFQPKLLREVRTGNYDAIIFLFDLAWLSHFLGFFLCPRHTRRITWGFWETKTELANKVRLAIARSADGNLFYASGAARYFLRCGLDEKKIWIARNTVNVEPAERDLAFSRDSLLFLGSFNPRKENDVLIAAFDEACAYIPSEIKLVLVGDGPAKASAQAQAAQTANSSRIEFYPGTHDDEMIRAFYARALASISFGQAGLSVLQSFGHGVPFITKEGAISGGESENIVSGSTGLISAPTQKGLREVLIALCNDPEKVEILGQRALEYYKKSCSAQAMAAGFAEAIENIHRTTEKI
jgi:glycosyltransferase involved in cell wall biosynthesis